MSEEALAYLLGLPKFGGGVGLHRMLELCEQPLGCDWARGLDAIKITGSNGKGSTAAMTAAILDALDLQTGLYTSPHLLRFHERIVVAGGPISDSELAASARWCARRCQRYQAEHPGDSIGAFEAFTALALHHYANRRPDALVVEAGMGGRYDSTRVIPGQLVGLASLDLEHTQTLGETLELIAYDKADLCPSGGTLVVGAVGEELQRRLRAYGRLRSLEVISAVERRVIHAIGFEGTHMVVDLDVDGLRIPELVIGLPGYPQVDNAVLAILLSLRWIERHRPEVSAEARLAAIRRGLAAVRWPGRFERIHRDPEVFIDVGHTPDAIRRLVETVKTALMGRRILLVTGVSQDKALEPMVTQLVEVAQAVIATRAHHKGSPVSRVEHIVREAAPDVPCSAAETIELAMKRALTDGRRHDMTVLVAGGLFLAVEAMVAIRGEDPRQLRFF